MANVDRKGRSARRAPSFLIRVVVLLFVGNAVALAAVDEDSGRSADAASQAAHAQDDARQASEPDNSGSAATLPTVPATSSTMPAASGVQSSGGTSTTLVPGGPSVSLKPYAFKVTLQPTCTHVGGQFALTVRVKPQATVGVIATYADGDTHETTWGETAGDSGIVIRTLPAPPSAVGQGEVLTGAIEPDTNRNGTTTLRFRVVDVTESC